MPHPYRDPSLPLPPPVKYEWPTEDLALAGLLGPAGIAIAVFGQGPTELTIAVILVGLAASVLRDAYRVCSRRPPPRARRTP